MLLLINAKSTMFSMEVCATYFNIHTFRCIGLSLKITNNYAATTLINI